MASDRGGGLTGQRLGVNQRERWSHGQHNSSHNTGSLFEDFFLKIGGGVPHLPGRGEGGPGATLESKKAILEPKTAKKTASSGGLTRPLGYPPGGRVSDGLTTPGSNV